MKELNFEILKRFLENTTDEKETASIIKWMAINELTEKQLKKLLEFPEGVRLFEKIDSEKDWLSIRKKLFPEKKSYNVGRFLRVAASMAILAGLFGLLFAVYKIINRPIVIANHNNGVELIMLPDSSQVFLNKNSEIIYRANYLKKRELTLRGQVFFEVKKNKKKPFVVKANECIIKVLGTSFAVETKQSDVEVIVETGKVAFCNLKIRPDTLFLTKGKKGIFSARNHSLNMKMNEDANYLAWQNHILIFNNSPIVSVVKDIERYFKIKIILDRNVAATLRYTSEFHNPALKDILKEMELALNLHYNLVDKIIIIYQK
jgi:transmembrane sensor